LLGLLVLLAASSSGRRMIRTYGPATTAPAPPAGARNALVIVWDTVRSPSLSLYGYAPGTTPHPPAWAPKRGWYGLGPVPGPLPPAQQLLHRPLAVQARFPVEFLPRRQVPDPGGIPGLEGLSDRRLRREHPGLQLRDRAGSRLRRIRGLPDDAPIPPGPDGPRE